MIVALDYDSTCTLTHSFPEVGEPRKWLIDTAIKWREEGHKIILWTCRENIKERAYLDEAVQMCKENGLEFDAINMNLAEVKYPGIRASRKVVADVYIDDRNVMFIENTRKLIFPQMGGSETK